MSLIAYLQQILDYRTQPRYPLWVVLLLVIMGTMSGCLGYRALEDFVQRHQKVLLELMELPLSASAWMPCTLKKNCRANHRQWQ
ncbi:MAG: transposase family protein [Hydrococcus sp. RM1_1_31]|nr:transposase family protein [Hydrococcus sp. RM1_1_31]